MLWTLKNWLFHKRSHTPVFLNNLLIGCTTIGCIQTGLGILRLHHFTKKAETAKEDKKIPLPPVSILKPLANQEPLLFEALKSFCEQDYPEFQIVFGVQDPEDPAIQTVNALKRHYPHLDIRLVIDPVIHGTNRKVSNLMNMLKHATHDYLLIADSDIHTPHATYLREIIPLLNEPQIGLVTSLYSGLPAKPSFIQHLAAANINYNFLPGVLLARSLGRQDCLGASNAIKRSVLDQIGGLEALLSHVADDAVLGQLIAKHNLKTVLAPSIVKTTVSENTLTDLYKHELRWNRTVFSVEPIGFLLSFLQLPLFWAGLSLLLYPRQRRSWLVFTGCLVFKSLCARFIHKKIKLDLKIFPFILPYRDWLSAFIMIKSIREKDVEWRGQKMTIEKTTVSNFKQ